MGAGNKGNGVLGGIRVMESHTYVYKLDKIAVLAECISDIVKSISVDRDLDLKKSLKDYAAMIYNTAEQMKINERILNKKIADDTIDKATEKPEISSVKVVDGLPEVGDSNTLYLSKNNAYLYDDGKPVAVSEAKELTAFEFAEMFDNAYQDIAEVLTRNGKVTITKYLMFPENSFNIDIGGGYAIYPCNKLQLAEYLNENGILSYTLTKMECR